MLEEIKNKILCYYDKNNNKQIKIDCEENIYLHDALLNSFSFLGISKNVKDIEFIIKKYHYNCDGYITFEDFFNILDNELELFVYNKDIEYMNQYISKSPEHQIDNLYLLLKHKIISPIEYQQFKEELKTINHDLFIFFKNYII